MFVGQKLGPFEIDKELGSGAMGTVYRAKMSVDGKTSIVALKIVAIGLLGNESAMARFEREASILKQLRHPHIVRLVATGKFGKGHPTPFIAMEFVEGESLDRFLARRIKLGWEEVVDYARQLCSALQYAHDKGIIHRDLKPSNLMVAKDGTLKLTDFGIAKDTDVTALTGANSTIGTAAYMSPEQCHGERNLTPKSDLYSLGVVLFELITGRKPFTAETTVEMFMKHVKDVPPRPSKFVSDLPVWLDNLIMFLLEKDKNIRPLDAATVGKMLDDIKQKMQNQQSAGLEVATSKRKDRAGGPLSEEDLEAARALKSGKSGKKPKKKKGTPLLQRQWVRAIPAVVAALGVVAALVYFFSPPGQQALADAVGKAGDTDAKIKAAESYLAKYGGGTDEITQSVRKQLRETRGKQLEQVLDNRFRKDLSKPTDRTDEAAYTDTWAAMEYEQKGDLAGAAKLWTKVKGREAEIGDDYREGWGWLADDRLRQLKEVDDKIKALREQLKDMEVNEKPWKFDAAEPESLAKYAIRLGASGGVPLIFDDPARHKVKHVSDIPKARRVYADLAKMTEKKADQRAWFLLAVRERGPNFDPKADDGKARLENVQKQAEAINAEWDRLKDLSDVRAERSDCRNRARELVECYADETDEALKKVVEETRKLLETMK